MDAWLDAEGRFFNPNPVINTVPLVGDACCVVIDNALANPQGLADWAATQTLRPPVGYPYPGKVLDAPTAVTQGVAEYFAQHARARLGGRRTLDLTVRVSMVTVPPDQLEPRQWQCHRDRVANDPSAVLFAASVLYLFSNPALGGTSFYVPRLSATKTDQMQADSQLLNSQEFQKRHGVQPGYMAGSNVYFERVARVPAAWNRIIFYDGGLFHSGDIDEPRLLSDDPRIGRLSLNSFFTCKRIAV
jgi:Family of unknown function (DUF6445)